MSLEQGACPTIGELTDYWNTDLAAPEMERIEAHVFECEACARLLAETYQVTAGIAQLVRSGRFQAIVTEAVLNRLSREGVRVRTYTLHPGAVVPCAVWAGDEVVATRLRGDFRGYDSLNVLTRFGDAGPVERITGLPAGADELIEAFSAARLRELPSIRVHVTVTGETEGQPERVIADYTLDHAGFLER